MHLLGTAKPVNDLRAEPTSHAHAEVIEGIAPDELEKVLTGRKLLHARRKGKQMWMELDGEAPALMFHFGMLFLEGLCMLTAHCGRACFCIACSSKLDRYSSSLCRNDRVLRYPRRPHN